MVESKKKKRKLFRGPDEFFKMRTDGTSARDRPTVPKNLFPRLRFEKKKIQLTANIFRRFVRYLPKKSVKTFHLLSSNVFFFFSPVDRL